MKKSAELGDKLANDLSVVPFIATFDMLGRSSDICSNVLPLFDILGREDSKVQKIEKIVEQNILVNVDDVTGLFNQRKLNNDLDKWIEDENFWTSSRKQNNQLYTKPQTNYVVFNNDDMLHWCYHMPLSKKKKITLSIISAVIELHTQKIVHADIKPNNI